MDVKICKANFQNNLQDKPALVQESIWKKTQSKTMIKVYNKRSHCKEFMVNTLHLACFFRKQGNGRN